MFDMLDVAIGIIFVFLLVSLIASAALEAIQIIWKKRGRDLQKGIEELLRDNPVMVGIYNHPLVNGLYKGATYPATRRGDLPSYIPARNFALALMDIAFSQLAAGAVPAVNGAQGATTPAAAVPIVAGGGVMPTPPVPAPVNIAALPAGAPPAAVANPNLARTLRLFAEAAALDPSKTRENIENWYNTAMDRVSGKYKRRSQWLLLLIGLVLAGVMNVDAIRVTRELTANKTLREAVVAKAITFDKAYPQPSSSTSSTGGAVPTGEVANKTLAGLGLPIGWTPCPCSAPSDGGCLAWMIIGWLITACAVSLGAPFWFDMLNKIIVVRSTVKPQEKSGTEAPKDPTK
jgi:hypothetical protein